MEKEIERKKDGVFVDADHEQHMEVLKKAARFALKKEQEPQKPIIEKD